MFTSAVSDDSPKTNGILFIGENSVMYGDVTLACDMTIPEDYCLTIDSGTLTIAAGVTLTNNGTILLKSSTINQGGAYGTIIGSGGIGSATINIAYIQGITVPVPGDVPVQVITETDQYTGTVQWSPNHSKFEAGTIYTATIILTAKNDYVFYGVPENFFTVAGARSVTCNTNSGEVKAAFSTANADYNAFDISEGLIKIEKGSDLDTIKVTYGGGQVKDNIPKENQIFITGNYSGSSIADDDVVYVAPDVTVSIRLNDLSISLTNDSSVSVRNAFNIDGGNVTMELSGENTLSSAWNAEGLRVPEGASVTIFGNGSLVASSYTSGAGIGGNYNNENCGTVIINSGKITAYGGTLAAGIGGGWGSAGGTLTVNGGIVYAHSGNNGPGIGGEFILNGNAVVFNQFVTANSTLTKGIIFYGRSEWSYTGEMHGDVTIDQNITFPSNSTLYVESGTITVKPGITLTVDGTIHLENDAKVLYGGEYGTVNGIENIMRTINTAAIQGITVPIAGAVPVTVVTETEQYTGTVKWSPAHSGILGRNKLYRYNHFDRQTRLYVKQGSC